MSRGSSLADRPHADPRSTRGTRIDVLVVADNRLYREMLAEALGKQQGIRVLDTAADAGEALMRARSLSPHLILLDMAMADSVSAARALSRELPGAKLLALDVPEAELEAVACTEARAAGYVSRSASLQELIEAVKSVARGELLCSPKMAAVLLRRVHAGDAGLGAGLTRREREILTLIDDGLSNRQIAERLCIELATVKNHVHAILEKLGVARRGEAAALVRRRLGTTG